MNKALLLVTKNLFELYQCVNNKMSNTCSDEPLRCKLVL